VLYKLLRVFWVAKLRDEVNLMAFQSFLRVEEAEILLCAANVLC